MEFIPTLITTLLSNGFRVINTSHKPTYLACIALRVDDLGVRHTYVVACAPPKSKLSETDVEALQKLATRYKAALVVVGQVQKQQESVPVLTHQAFLSRLGGPVSALLPLEME